MQIKVDNTLNEYNVELKLIYLMLCDAMICLQIIVVIVYFAQRIYVITWDDQSPTHYINFGSP